MAILGSLALVGLVYYLFFFISSAFEDKKKQIGNEFKFYKEHSKTFYSNTYGLEFPQDIKRIEKLLSEFKLNKNVLSEIEAFNLRKITREYNDAKKNLFLYNNLEILYSCLILKHTVKKDFNYEINESEFKRRLYSVFEDETKVISFIGEMKNLELITSKEKHFIFLIYYVVHPYKKDEKGDYLVLAIDESLTPDKISFFKE